MNNLTTSNLFTYLKQQNFISEDTREDSLLKLQSSKHVPIYINILIGIGAFLGALFFTGFLSITRILNLQEATGFYVVGTLSLGLAHLLFFTAKIPSLANETSHRTFTLFLKACIQQISYAFLLLGHFLLTTGVALDSKSTWAVTLTLGILLLVHYPLYPTTLSRYLGTVAFLTSLILSCHLDQKTMAFWPLVYLDELIFLVGFGAFFLPNLKSFFYPALRGCITVGIGYLIVIEFRSSSAYYRGSVLEAGSLNLVLTALLMLYGARKAWSLEQHRYEVLTLLLIGCITLCSFTTPPIILSLLLFIAGMSIHDRTLWVSGLIFLPASLILYYYNMEITLLEKSGILILNGLLLLLANLYLQFRFPKKG